MTGDGREIEPRLVGSMDPVTDLLRGALAYHDAAMQLPDEHPAPCLRLRRRVDAPRLRFAVDRYRGEELTDQEELLVTRLPIDRAGARPRQRIHPAVAPVLRVGFAIGDDATDVVAPAVGATPGPDGTHRVTLPGVGPGPQDIHDLVAVARAYRMVAFDAPFRGEPAQIAAMVLQLVGAGIACWCPRQILDVLELLGPRLRAALAFDPAELATDDLLLAARVADQKRAAWSEHDLRLAWGPSGAGPWVPHLRPVPRPPVSIVLTSRRPELVPVSLAMIAAQQDVELEVVVALHGGGDEGPIAGQLRRLELPGRVLSVPAAVPFGAVVNHAISMTSGPVVLKWDDDDLYGPRHVEDLLVARRQTGAAMVGKAAEFVYLDRARRTIWRNPARAESSSIGQAGGTFLLDRAVLDEVGGYPDVTRAIDHHLKVRLRERGTVPFRTHGFGFVLRRHGQGHTWDATDDAFLAQAVRTFDGLPDILQLGAAAQSAGVRGG